MFSSVSWLQTGGSIKSVLRLLSEQYLPSPADSAMLPENQFRARPMKESEKVQFWLMKSEPSVYSIQDLLRDGKTAWEGVRNYQARNFMRDEMQVGDLVLFYHSNADPSGVAGVAKVAGKAYPDAAAFDRKSRYFDERSTPEKPLWFLVDVAFVAAFKEILSLEKIKQAKELEGIMVARRGMRLSIQPVSEAHFKHICSMAGCRLPEDI